MALKYGDQIKTELINKANLKEHRKKEQIRQDSQEINKQVEIYNAKMQAELQEEKKRKLIERQALDHTLQIKNQLTAQQAQNVLRKEI